jgi:small subunit ribosomal protein S14
MQKLIQKDKKRRFLSSKYEMKRVLFKSMSRDSFLPKDIRLKCLEKLAELPRNSSPIRVRNRCTLTGRSRGHLRLFRMSRITFRELAGEGLLPGVLKSSW